MPTLREISAAPPGNMREREGKCHGTVGIFLFSFWGRQSPAPGPPFLLLPARWFAYENRIHWLCGQSYENRIHWLRGQSYANPAGTRATFSALSGAPVCVRKPNSLTLRALVRKPCRRPDHLFCSLVDRNRCKGLSNICRKMCRLGFQKIFCSYSDFASLCSRNSSECLFNSFS